MIGLAWRLVVVLAGVMLFYVSGTMAGDQLWLSMPGGLLIGFGVASAYLAESDL